MEKTAVNHAELYLCLKILFKNFIDIKNLHDAANILKEHDAISKGQKKKVIDACNKNDCEKALERLIKAFENKDEVANLRSALQSKDFPFDHQPQTMALYLIDAQDVCLMNVIKNWENLSLCQTELRELDAGRPWDEDGVKSLLFDAFEEIKKDSDEKKMSDLIFKAVEMHQRSIQGSVQNQRDSVKNKPQEIKAQSLSDDSEMVNKKDENSEINLKRPQKSDLEDTSSKRQKSQESQKNQIAVEDEPTTGRLAESTTFKVTNPNSENERRLKDSGKDVRRPNKGKKKDQLKKSREENATGDSDTAISLEGDSALTENKSAEGGQKMPKEQNSSAKESAGSKKDKRISATSQNEHKPDDADQNGGEWTMVSNKRPNTRSQTAAEKAQGKGPLTRSQTAGKGDVEKDNTAMVETGITLLPPEAFVNYTEEDERVLEIRAVVSSSCELPANTSLCMACKESNWKPVEMGFNDRKGYFFLQILHPSSGYFKFKFCYTGQFAKKVEWEYLPESSYGHVNRMIDLSQVKTSRAFILNVCIFYKTYSYAAACCKGMAKFLPRIEADDYTANETSLLTDLFYWVNCVKSGWRTTAWLDNNHKPSDYEFEEILVKWLETLNSSVSNDSKNKFLVIHIALTLAVTFATEKHLIRTKLLIKLFKMLNLHGLENKNCKKLLDATKKVMENVAEFCIEMTNFRQALEWLYKQLPSKPNLDWVMSLPLYWLLVHGEARNEVMDPIPKRTFMYSRSSLPSIENFDWNSVQRSMRHGGKRFSKEFISAILETYTVHPWILDTLQYLMTFRELEEMISSKESGIGYLLSLDSVLNHYLIGINGVSTSNRSSWNVYFLEKLTETIRLAAEPEIQIDDKIKQIGVCTNMIMFINGFLDKNMRTLDTEDTYWCIGIMGQKIAYWASLLDLDKKDLNDFHEELSKMLEFVKKRIHQRKADIREIDLWNKLLQLEWNIDRFAAKWVEQIVYEMKSAINNTWLSSRSSRIDGEKFLDFYVEKLSKMDLVSDVEKCFDEVAYKCLEEMLRTMGQEQSLLQNIAGMFRNAFQRTSTGPKSRFITLFEKLFRRSHEKVLSRGGSSLSVGLNFVCSWSFSAYFYELFGQDLPETFDKTTRTIAQNVARDIMEIIKNLHSAEISIEHLKVILDKREQFLRVWSVLIPDATEEMSSVDFPKKDESVTDAISFCKKSWKIFRRTQAAVEDFILICNYAEHNDESPPHASLEAKCKLNVQKMRICDLVKAETGGMLSSNQFFGITEDQLQEFHQISFIKDSMNIFREMFAKAVDAMRNASGDGNMNQWPQLLQAFTNVKHEIFRLVEEIHSGTINLDAVMKRFKMLDGRKKEIDFEVDLMYDFSSQFQPFDEHEDENENIQPRKLMSHDLRKRQIFNTFQLQSADRAVNVLLRLRDLLSLKGDFGILTTRKDMIENQNQVQLQEVPEVLKIPGICSLDDLKLNTLEKFMEAQEVIEWLQKKMKGMNEVKVMCDLAMISAGEDAVEVDRVSNLLSAVMGFDSLIFWLEKERNEAGSKELVERCEKVWEKESGIKNLLKKWEETRRQLSWFKEVEKFYGSVEKSSLTRAQEINERGIYRIFRKKDNQPPTEDTCVSLEIPGKTASDVGLILSLEELIELQSKLMLIAGEAEKGQQDVNIFVEVLASVQKLAKIFVSLVLSGCMLFVQWEASIVCQKGGYVEIRVQFAKDAPNILGKGKHLEIDTLTEILKRSYDKWEEYICSKRMEFYHLNEFNIQQIMYLCHELSNLELDEVPDQVRILLSFVRKHFGVEDLKDCLQDARKQIQESKVSSVLDGESDTTTDGEQMQQDHGEDNGFAKHNKIKGMLKAMHTLVGEDQVPEEQAKAAIHAAGYDDLGECVTWILSNGLDDELVEQYSEEFDKACGALPEYREVLSSVFSENSENTLEEVIVKLQKETGEQSFLDCIHTICTGYLDDTIAISLRDYFSIDLLGKFLNNLKKEEKICRNLLMERDRGHPNLLICGEDDILLTVLSLYMHNADQPLPTRSEVLICSEMTKKEEVERFLMRAMYKSGNEGHLLYTLAFADKLNYYTSSCVEDVYNELSKSAKLDCQYQLVILLSKQQHYLATCFEKYLVDKKWSKSAMEIQQYLKHHLQVIESKMLSAASITYGNYMVKVVTSTRSGVGKSLYVQRLIENLQHNTARESCNVIIRLLENKLNVDNVIEKLSGGGDADSEEAAIVHIDLTPAVQSGIEPFIFNFFILGSLQGSDGKVQKIHRNHLYVVEMTDFGTTGEKRFSKRHILSLLPCVRCHSPQEVLDGAFTGGDEERLGMDEKEFRSETFQRPFQYLSRYQSNADLDAFVYATPQDNIHECIQVLLRHCGIQDPSWAQLRHFCSFLNVQLQNCEISVFCTNQFIKQELVGLKAFAVKFMIKMAQDFATPSLQLSDKSIKDTAATTGDDQGNFMAHQIRRKWEESSHPYVFFNEDGQTMTFINVKIDKEGYLLDQSGQRMEHIASPQLVNALRLQGFDLSKNFDEYSRLDKLKFLCQVLGKYDVYDPDPTYELTTDNVLKILAIYMRFRCQIPVIIMGETGCGKTRLVEFMSKLKSNNVGLTISEIEVKNMITLKIHGGITVQDIHKSVTDAEVAELQNRENGNYFTVLFYDEANTTEAIYAIKEVMCDKSIDGRSFKDANLQIVAACNPYKKLSKKAIQKLEDSGLGYRIRTSKTAHLFGNIPVRSLVYRVVALPPSMQPFVWDFGQLSGEAEKIYIQQMTRKLSQKLGLTQKAISMINTVLSNCQSYMRTRTDECRYVSLRDVERCMITYEWFHLHRDVIHNLIVQEVKKHIQTTNLSLPEIDPEVRSLIQTVGVCYHASLDNREDFRGQLEKCLKLPGIDEKYIEIELASCQSAFLQDVQIGDNIACNEALRENVFMMAICADMKIPLFLIGKPGSSKSLAKTIVTNNMQGQASQAQLYKGLKQIHILSYQCSALTDAEGIKRVFSQCSQLQSKQNPDAYTAVVVLDEIGLAEDSPNMPLKVLHPLLEHQSTSLRVTGQKNREHVGFVGISNWALDPAKMNRGIFLTRNRPTERDLKKTGKEIFQAKKSLWRNNRDLFETLTSAYLEVYQKIQEVEYFGLRDYYSLMKMICYHCGDSDEKVKFAEVVYAILRNFSGGKKDVVECFLANARKSLQVSEHDFTPTIPIQVMIQDNLKETNSRFLLLLANQFSVVNLLEACFDRSMQGAQVVFGSSFPGDHTYTEICRNINRVKVCMETGKTVVLLNMTRIHESLYDALNQHYVTFGGQNYVDLGLGGHRVKCRIADEFRLIVIEKKDVVYQEYPIPLINRMEKHHFNSSSLLNEDQHSRSEVLVNWAACFVKMYSPFTCRHAFVGFHDDTVSSVVLTADGDEDYCKAVLLQCCSMDSILRLADSSLHEDEIKRLQTIYFCEQRHDGLADVLRQEIEQKRLCVLEVTSFSGVLSKKDVTSLHKDLNVPRGNVVLLSLEQFNTQQEYSNRLDRFFARCTTSEGQSDPLILLVQCAQAQSQSSLIACARHCLLNKIRDVRVLASEENIQLTVTVALLLSTEREGASQLKTNILALQPTTETKIVHVDELRPADDHIAPAGNFYKKSLCDVFEAGRLELIQGRRPDSLINIQSLLLDCVCEALTKVEGSFENDERYLQRVEILTYLCSEGNTTCKTFREIILKKIVDLYSVENDGVTTVNWAAEKANDRESLQEGGTFRKTLWLCLKWHLSKFLAYVVSITDQCNNLNLIAETSVVPWKLNMWLGMFCNLEIAWKDIIEPAKFIVGGVSSSCFLPFSYLVITFLNTQWNALRSHGMENFDESFFRLFHTFKCHKVINEATDFAKVDIMKCFVSDLIWNMYKRATSDEKEILLVKDAVFDIALRYFQDVRDKDFFKKGDEVAVIFLTFMTHSEQLEKFSEILQSCPGLLQNLPKWQVQQKNSPQLILHTSAFKDALSLMKGKAKDIQDPKACVAWIALLRNVKKIFDSIRNIIHDEDDLKTLDSDWDALLLLDSFLLHLLPPAHLNNATFQNFVKIIGPCAKLFWSVSTVTDSRSYRFLQTMLDILKRCHRDLYTYFLTGSHDNICKICKKKVNNPTFLPCKHFACENCLSLHCHCSNTCMCCSKKIPEDFVLHPAELDRNGSKILSRMRSNFTSFFLDFLHQYCYKIVAANTTQAELSMQEIIKQLVVQTDGDIKQQQLDRTALELNINTRSCILQDLLFSNRSFVVAELDKWLSATEGEQRNSLVLVILKYCEQKLMTSSLKIQESEEKLAMMWKTLVERSWQKVTSGVGSVLNVELLQKVCEIRCGLQHYVSLVEAVLHSDDLPGAEDSNVRSFFCFCTSLFSESQQLLPMIQNFVIKCGCRKFGMQWFYLLSNHDDLKVLMPSTLYQAGENCSKDHWSLLGTKYTDFKGELYHIRRDALEEKLKTCLDEQNPHFIPSVLALMSWSEKSEDDLRNMVADMLKDKCANHFLVTNFVEKQEVMKSVLKKYMKTEQQVEVVYQLIVMAVIASMTDNAIMKEFNDIIRNPLVIENLFLPTMPEDIYFATPDSYRTELMATHSMYTCPKGHLYSIGDCTNPVVESVCPTCKSTIGGKSYQTAVGNKRIFKKPESQAGYKQANSIENATTGADRMSLQGSSVVQFILHSCLLTTTLMASDATQDQASLLSIPRILHCTDMNEAQKYLIQQLQNNLTDLSSSLARNVDDAVLVLHKILIGIMEKRQVTTAAEWTMAGRKVWEQIFRKEYLTPVLQILGEVVDDAQKVMRETKEIGSIVLTRLILEDPSLNILSSEFSLDDLNSILHDPLLWTVIEHPNSAQLMQVLQDEMDQSSGEALHVMLHMPDLHFIRFLGNILELQRKLIARYQYRIDINDADQRTFRCHIEDSGQDDESSIKEYIHAWNEVHTSLKAVAPDYLSKLFHRLSMESPVSMALPSVRGRGQCAKLLSEFLIELQNQFLHKCIEVIKPVQRIKEVGVDQLTSADIICIEKRKDLLSLINMHTNYTITTGENRKHHIIKYNIEALEKQVREKYVMCKKLIKKNTLPCIKYPQDIGIGSDWQNLKETCSQEPLTPKISQDIDQIVKKSHSSDVCDGVRTLTNAISFLAKVKPDPSKSLCEFLEKDLKLRSTHASIIPRSAQISHTLSLYQRLTWHKAVLFVHQGLDPYKEALSGIKQEEIPDDTLKITREALQHKDVEILQQRINEMLITGTGIDSSDWILKEDVFPWMQFLDKSEDDSWYCQLPEELCNKHLEHLFRLSVSISDNLKL